MPPDCKTVKCENWFLRSKGSWHPVSIQAPPKHSHNEFKAPSPHLYANKSLKSLNACLFHKSEIRAIHAYILIFAVMKSRLPKSKHADTTNDAEEPLNDFIEKLAEALRSRGLQPRKVSTRLHPPIGRSSPLWLSLSPTSASHSILWGAD